MKSNLMISETHEQTPCIETWFNHLIINYTSAEQRQLKQALDIYQYCFPTMPQTNAIFTIVEMLVRLRLDAKGLIAAILHLLVENDKLTVEAVKTTFGEETAQLLENAMRMQLLKDLYHLQFQENISPDEKSSHLESIRVMILAMISDVRVVLIKLVERLYEMQQLDK